MTHFVIFFSFTFLLCTVNSHLAKEASFMKIFLSNFTNHLKTFEFDRKPGHLFLEKSKKRKIVLNLYDKWKIQYLNQNGQNNIVLIYIELRVRVEVLAS